MKEQRAIETEFVDSKTIKIDLEDYIWLTKKDEYSYTMSMIIKKLRRELEEYRAKSKK